MKNKWKKTGYGWFINLTKKARYKFKKIDTNNGTRHYFRGENDTNPKIYRRK